LSDNKLPPVKATNGEAYRTNGEAYSKYNSLLLNWRERDLNAAHDNGGVAGSKKFLYGSIP
jgi:hypothetical protein